MKIIDININEQKKALFRKKGGGNEWKNLDEKGKKQVLNEKEILELASLIKKIEDHYGLPQDIEWAQENGKFFITQSRPITTLKNKNSINKVQFSKYLSREHSFFYADVWNDVNKSFFDKYVKNTNIKNMIFKRNNIGVLEVYYDMTELENVFKQMAQAVSNKPEILDTVISDFYIYWGKLLPYIKRKKEIQSFKELKEYQQNWKNWWAPMAYIFALGDMKDLPKTLQEKALEVRIKTQEYSDEGDRILLQYIYKKYPKYKKLLDLMCPSEIFRIEKLTKKEIKEIESRKDGIALVTVNGKSAVVSSAELQSHLKKNNANIIIEKKDNKEIIQGQSASTGITTGIVKLILIKKDLKKFKKDEIMVTYATSPDYVPYMKKAAAIIANEGGVVCHAAIVSRELGLPCVVGTKNATELLKDGDLVEVDADEGVVRILEKKGKDKEDKILDFVKNNKFQKQFVYSFLPIICFESANYCYINNPLKEKLGIKEFPSFVILWKDNYEDWGGGNIQKIKDKKQIQFIIDENRKIVEKYKERVNSLLKIKYKELTNKEIVKILREIDEISIEIYHRYIYLIHDYFETEDKGFIKLLPEVRIEMSEFVDKLYKSCDSIIEALAEKFESIPWKTFLYATFEEIIHLLENPETINEFKKVYKRSISFVFNGEKLSIIKEKERVEKIINILENQKQDIGNDIDRFEGNIAFKGNAKGRVVKVLEFDYEKVNNVLKDNDDYVLVTPMTRPEFVPYLKKCKAIVTDEGGITCHAAIVSRELKKPCIIGTKIATQVLNDGDLVEVDADEGVVRILEKGEEMKKIFTKEHSREYSLFRIGSWFQAMGSGLEKIIGKGVSEACAVHRKNTGLVDVYYESSDLNTVFSALTQKCLDNPDYIKKEIKIFLNLFDELKLYYLCKRKISDINELKEVFKLYSKVWGYTAIVYVIPTLDGIDSELKKIALKAREETQEYNESIEKVFKKFIESKYPDVADVFRFILPEEIWNKSFLDKGVLRKIKKRRSGFVLYKNKLHIGVEREVLEKLNIELSSGKKIKEGGKELNGEIAQKGAALGFVKIVFIERDLKKIKENDILVTPMTMPRFLPYMKKASAFVTDEGGITCHAAIMAREMKKPCIIGTKIATQVLNDGDLVEVDADEGVVKIIKRNK